MASDDRPDGASGDPGMGNPPTADNETHRGATGDDRRDGPGPVAGPGALDPDVQLLHDAEHALEWLQRARGHLLAFHHSVGRAMDKLAVVETGLRAAGHDDLADRVRDDLLPAGITDSGAWSYSIVEEFETGPLTSVERFETDLREQVADGDRHVAERAQQERWRDRAEVEDDADR